VLYLIPLFLLALDWRNARLLTVTLVLVNLLEWPVLLSRGWFQLLPVTVIVRTLLLLLASTLFLAAMQPPLRHPEETPGLARL
jgi:hypothetical protein